VKAINRFASSGNRPSRVMNASKILYMFVKNGSKEVLKKVNPVLVIVDAVISLIDLGISYMKYKKQKEINEVLKKELDTIKKELETKRELIKEELKEFEIEIELASENFMDILVKEKEKLAKHYEVIIQMKDSLIILKDFYLESNNKKELEKIIILQNVFIELLIK